MPTAKVAAATRWGTPSLQQAHRGGTAGRISFRGPWRRHDCMFPSLAAPLWSRKLRETQPGVGSLDVRAPRPLCGLQPPVRYPPDLRHSLWTPRSGPHVGSRAALLAHHAPCSLQPCSRGGYGLDEAPGPAGAAQDEVLVAPPPRRRCDRSLRVPAAAATRASCLPLCCPRRRRQHGIRGRRPHPQAAAEAGGECAAPGTQEGTY